MKRNYLIPCIHLATLLCGIWTFTRHGVTGYFLAGIPLELPMILYVLWKKLPRKKVVLHCELQTLLYSLAGWIGAVGWNIYRDIPPLSMEDSNVVWTFILIHLFYSHVLLYFSIYEAWRNS